ncbi:pentatricopeptide repeat-containing protein [Tanacetum coccineum]
METHGRTKSVAELASPARDPRDVEMIERLQQRIQELEFQLLQQDSPTEETETESNVWDDGSEDVNPFGGVNPRFHGDHHDNPLLTKETESEPIIWDIGDEEDEYPFVNEYPSFKEEPIIFLEDESCPVYDIDNEEAESMPVYDTNIKDFNEEEGKMDEARKLFDLMEEKGVVGNVVTYNALIYGHCKDGKVDKALDIVEKLETKELKLNFRTYNELISGFCKGDNVHKAMALFDKMMKMKLSPTVMTYNLLINGQCKQDYVDNAYRLIGLMKENGDAPDEWTYSSIIEAICKRGSVEEAHTLLDSLKEKGVKVNEVIYTTLIDRYFQKGKADSRTNLFLEMLITGCLPNSWTYTVMINGFYKDDKMQELELFSVGRKVLETLEVLYKQSLKRSSFHQSISLLHIFEVSKFLDDIYDLMSGKKGELLSLFSVESMIKKELDQNIHALATALENGKSCAREDTTRVQIALSDMRSLSNLFAELKVVQMVELESTTTTQVEGTGDKKNQDKETGDASQVELMLEKQTSGGNTQEAKDKKKGKCNNNKGLLRSSDFDDARKLFILMVSSGLKLNVCSYTSFILVYCSQGMVTEAEYIMIKMIKEGVEPDTATYTVFIDMYGRLGQVDSAFDVLKRMHK